MLCHTALDRAAQVARYWAERDCPVVVHIDRRTPAAGKTQMRLALRDLDNVRFSRRTACEWGSWGIVAATQEASALLLREFPRVRHVFLASGSCLPLRPVEELRAYLDERPGTDFIESVTTADVGWTVGGLNAERFTLRFPFSWRRHRHLFDAYTELQRRLGVCRRLPGELVPHLGSQWWCLTRPTLSAILESPGRERLDRYFRRVWIPDESYFQSLVRNVSTDVESRSLTLSKFDREGRPHVFYDDHLQLLRRSDCFVARKIWPGAERLYQAFLRPQATALPRAEPNPGRIDRLFRRAGERRANGRPGLYMQSRFPARDLETGRTAAPYSLFAGFAELFGNFETWLGKTIGARVHGHLFDPDRVHFSGGASVYNGALSDSASLRDYNPKSFLTNLIWNTRGERQCFQFGPNDRQEIAGFIAGDPNARISVITGAFAIPLFRSDRDFNDIRAEVARLQRIEADLVSLLRSPWVKARVGIWNLAEFAEAPAGPLQGLIDEILPRSPRPLSELPDMVDLTGFGHFLQRLRNQGMQPLLMGDFPADGSLPAGGRRRPNPHRAG